jgi:hypothetical protein
MSPLESFYLAYIRAIHKAMAGVYQSTYNILDIEFEKQKQLFLSQTAKDDDVDDVAVEADKAIEVEQSKAQPLKNRGKK